LPNPGAYPLNPNTPTGQFRLLTGDTQSVPLDPPVSGQQDYEKFSDAEIEGYLAAGGDSIPRAIGFAYLYLASRAAMESKSIRDFDLQVDLTKRAADLRAIAQMWFDRADGDDEASAEEAFEVVPTGRSHGGVIPEGSIAQWGRAYTWESTHPYYR
jgi:hypothetical protein